MSVEISREVKLALSYIEDAEREYESFRHHDNPHIVANHARDLLDGDLAKAETALQKSSTQGDDNTAARIELMMVQAKVALSAASGLEQYKNIDNDTRQRYLNWVNIAIAKYGEVVSLAPSPSSNFLYGQALYFGDREHEALEVLRVVEQSNNEELSIEATKLVTKIEEYLARNPKRRGATSTSSPQSPSATPGGKPVAWSGYFWGGIIGVIISSLLLGARVDFGGVLLLISTIIYIYGCCLWTKSKGYSMVAGLLGIFGIIGIIIIALLPNKS